MYQNPDYKGNQFKTITVHSNTQPGSQELSITGLVIEQE